GISGHLRVAPLESRGVLCYASVKSAMTPTLPTPHQRPGLRSEVLMKQGIWAQGTEPIRGRITVMRPRACISIGFSTRRALRSDQQYSDAPIPYSCISCSWSLTFEEGPAINSVNCEYHVLCEVPP